MSKNGAEISEIMSTAFKELGELEKDFATVELDALRQKEYSLKELYEKRNILLEQIPGFWSTILPEGPEEFQSVLSPADAEIIAAVKSVNVERYQIKSEKEGEPRSLRFTFEFEENEFFEDTKVVKEFEYKTRNEGGGFVSVPLTFRWKKQGKALGLNKLLDLVVNLYKAEDALADGKQIENSEREGLWQYEKLREAIEKSEEDETEEPSFLNWFGFRGAVEDPVKPEPEDEEDEIIDEGLLEVEIFPAGEEVAIALAEEMWPNVMDIFIAATTQESDFEDLDEDDEDEDGEAPKLVAMEEFEGFEEEEDLDDEGPPAKKQKKT